MSPTTFENKQSASGKFLVKFIDRFFRQMGRSKQYRKTRELILYVAHGLVSKVDYNETLLNKALYFIDNVSYLRMGKPISDLTYIKQGVGPAPDPETWASIQKYLLDSGEATVVKRRLIATRAADINHFTKAEVDLIDSTISSINDWSDVPVGDFSSARLAWEAAADKEQLPFYTFLLSFGTPSREGIERAKAELREWNESELKRGIQGQ